MRHEGYDQMKLHKCCDQIVKRLEIEKLLRLKALWKADWGAGDEGGDPSTSVTAFLSVKVIVDYCDHCSC